MIWLHFKCKVTLYNNYLEELENYNMNFFLKALIFLGIIISTNSSVQAGMFDTKVNGIYGGFYRDLYEFGPVVIDTVGSDLGVYVYDDLKSGFFFYYCCRTPFRWR